MAEIGPALREARIRARIDISEVEEETKIRAKYLRAIENEEWDLLPGPIYVRSFVKSYGDFLGLDSRLLVEEFKRRYEGLADPEFAASISARERDRGGRSGRADAGGGRGGRSGSARGGGARVSAPTGGPSIDPSQRPGLPPERRYAFGPKAALAVAILAILAALWVLGHHGAKKAGSGGAITPQGQSQHHAAGKHHARKRTRGKKSKHHSTTAKTSAVDASLTLVPTGTVWMCVEGPDNKVLVPGQAYSQGQTVPTVHAKTLFVRLGNNNVTATVDGRSYPIRPSKSAIVFKVTGSGARPISPGPTCSS